MATEIDSAWRSSYQTDDCLHQPGRHESQRPGQTWRDSTRPLRHPRGLFTRFLRKVETGHPAQSTAHSSSQGERPGKPGFCSPVQVLFRHRKNKAKQNPHRPAGQVRKGGRRTLTPSSSDHLHPLLSQGLSPSDQGVRQLPWAGAVRKEL